MTPGRGDALLEMRERQGAGNVEVWSVGNARPNRRFDRVSRAGVCKGVGAANHDVAAASPSADRLCWRKDSALPHAPRAVASTGAFMASWPSPSARLTGWRTL